MNGSKPLKNSELVLNIFQKDQFTDKFSQAVMGQIIPTLHKLFSTLPSREKWNTFQLFL